MISLDKAIREIHFPKDKEMLDKAITRLKFTRVIYLFNEVTFIKKKNQAK